MLNVLKTLIPLQMHQLLFTFVHKINIDCIMSQKLLTLEDICLVYQIVWERDKNAFICCIN
jgi:hypothetical protein